MFWRWLTRRKRPPSPAAPPPSPPLKSAPLRHGAAPPSRSASLPYRAAPRAADEVRPPNASPLARAPLSELLKVLLYLDDTFLSLDHVVLELRRHAGAAAALAQMALDPRVPSEPREAAVNALGMLDASPDAVVPALIEALADPETQGAAMRALVHVGARARAAIPALEEIAQKGRADPSAEARWSLLELDLERRAAHIGALFDMIARGREGTVYLEERRAFRLAAARVAARLGAEAEGGVDALLDLLTDPDEEAAGTAAYALGQTRARAAEVVPALVAALSRCRARPSLVVRGIAAFGREAAPAVPALIEALGRFRGAHRFGEVAEALGAIGPGALAAVPSLIQVLEESLDPRDKDVERRCSRAILALAGIRAPEAIPAMLRAVRRHMKQDFNHVHPDAVRAFGRMGHATPEVVDLLLDSLQHRTPHSASWQAAEAFGRLGLTSDRVVEALVRALSDECPNTRRAAAVSLCQLRVRSAEPALRAMIAREPEAFVREGAEEALGLLFGVSERRS